MDENGQKTGTTFKEVPDTLDDITAEWCEKALRKEGIITNSTKVSSVEVERLVNAETGALDGGGMTPSQMLRIKLIYSGDTSDNPPPSSMIAKHLNTANFI